MKRFSKIEASALMEASDFKIKKVLVAVSGGADSVATALCLKNIGLELIVLNCNFHLRGEESDRDFLFVREFCEIKDIPFTSIDFDVKEYMAIHKGKSIEMACRELRHEWFENNLLSTGFDRIATGHNADDNIETFFLNMLRGSGTRGLKGMTRDNGKIWRPLLSFHRKEILEYLESLNQGFVVDSTNLKSDFRRNFLRNEIFPLLRKEWQGFDSAMDKTISNISDENNLIEEFIKDNLPLPLQPLDVNKVITSKAPLLLLKRYIDPLGPFSSTIEEILAAIKANKPHIRRWRLKNGVVFLRNRKLFIEMGHSESCT